MDTRGIYRKFEVRRTDGKDAPGEKHHDCAYFIIDLLHDENAKAALRAYAKSCRKKRPQLAKDLGKIVRSICPQVTASRLMDASG